MATRPTPLVPLGEDPGDAALQQPPWRNAARLSSVADAAESFLARAGFDRGPWLAVALAGGIAAWLAWPRATNRTARVAGAALAYLAGRFALDFLRGGAARFDGLTAVQWLALAALASGALAAASAAFLSATRKTSPAGGVSLK